MKYFNEYTAMVEKGKSLVRAELKANPDIPAEELFDVFNEAYEEPKGITLNEGLDLYETFSGACEAFVAVALAGE